MFFEEMFILASKKLTSSLSELNESRAQKSLLEISFISHKYAIAFRVVFLQLSIPRLQYSSNNSDFMNKNHHFQTQNFVTNASS